MPASPPFKLFIIYAREDQPALSDLKSHLRLLEKRGDLAVWYDGEILPGQDWNDVIQTQLATADIVLLLISKHFFNSEYIERDELKKALDRHTKGETIVVPVILKPCLWDAHSEISALQVLPKDGKPVSSWSDSDEAFLDISRGIQSIINVKNLQYKEIKSKEEVLRSIELYYEFKQQQSYEILSLYKDNRKVMTSIAYHILGEMLFFGEGGAKQNHSEAFQYYYLSAQKGYKPACVQVGQMYQYGQGVNKDVFSAEQWYSKAERGGNPIAQYHLGALYEDEEDYEECKNWYLKAADQGYSKAKDALQRLGESK